MKRMALLKQITIFTVMLLLFMRIDVNGSSYSTENDSDEEFYSDNQGNFIFTDNNSKPYCVYCVRSNGEKTQIYKSPSRVDCVYCVDEYTYIATHSIYNNTLIIKIFGGMSESVFLDDIYIKKNYFVADNMEHMYAVDRSNPNFVRVFNYNGEQINEYNALGEITGLFLDEGTNDVFAVSNVGLFNVTAGFCKIGSVVPCGEFVVNKNLCTDSEGNIFRFDSLTGFSKILSTDYDLLCPTDEFVYGVRGKTVYRLNTYGKEISYINLSVDPERLLSSENNLAYIFRDRVSLIKISNMIKITDKVDESRASFDTTSKVSEKTDRSETESSYTDKNYDIRSNIIDISGEYIFLNKEMTLAELKRSIEYNDNILTVANHNGKIVTSGNVGTNWRLTFSGVRERTFYTVLPGDVTGEGNINSRDIRCLSEYLLEDMELSTAFLYAADINQDDVISLLDLYKIYKLS